MTAATLERQRPTEPTLPASAPLTSRPTTGGPDSLRILHVLRAPLGGLFRHVLDLTRAQIARGHRVGLITDSLTGGPNGERILRELEPSLALGLMRTPMRRAPGARDVFAFRKVARHIASLQPDVVHGHGSKGGLYARATGFFRGSENAIRAYTPHGGSFNQAPGSTMHRIYMLAEKMLARRTDVLLFESAFIGECFDHFVGKTRCLRRVIPNGIAPAEFVPVSPNPDAADFVYIGELRAAKGIDTLLTALAEIGKHLERRPRLVLVGSGPDKEALQQQAADLGLTGQVTFPGPMPARQGFAMGRIQVVPSRAESLPYIVLEAAGARIPMISTNVGGIPEIFGPYANRLLPCDNPWLLALTMLTMLQREPERLVSDAANLAEYVQGRFSFENMVEAVIEGYRAAMQARGGKNALAATG